MTFTIGIQKFSMSLVWCNMHIAIVNIIQLVSVSLSLRWMENVSLEVIATCGHPPELRGQKVGDIHVFKSCPENSLPPDDKVVAAPTRQKVKNPKLSLLKVPGLKAKPAKPKANQHKPAKNQPQRKPLAPAVTKKKKTLLK